MSHNGVIATMDTIPWGYIDIIYIQPPGSESWVLYDHRLEDAESTGYADAAGPISGMFRMRPSAED
eukprot:6288960-Heterocapsa_arctica.AAC.1